MLEMFAVKFIDIHVISVEKFNQWNDTYNQSHLTVGKQHLQNQMTIILLWTE